MDPAKKECCERLASGVHDPQCVGMLTTGGKQVEECCREYLSTGTHGQSCEGMPSGGEKKALKIKDERSIFYHVVNDHKKVKNLYSQFNATSDKEERNKIAGLIIKEITVHSFLEESILYPQFDKKLNMEGLNLHQHSVEEHQKVKNLLYKIDQNFEPSSEEFIATLNELMKELNHHIEDEENNILPKLQEKMSHQEEIDLGSSWESRLATGTHPTHPHPSFPTDEPSATMGAMVAKPFDIARDTARFGSDTTKINKDIHGK